MEISNEKYYDGFEGSAEITITLVKESNHKESIGMWDGYFIEIISQVKPEKNGWTGLAYYYHLDIGWYEESPWKVEDITEAYAQLKKIDTNNISPESKEILSEILRLFRNAQSNGYSLYIYYD